MDERTKATVKAIMNRRTVPKQYLSVYKMLDIHGMSQYKQVCCSRIANRIDDDHVLFDFINGCDILLDYLGIIKCEDVLVGYIPVETLEDYQNYMELENEIIQQQNTQIELLQKCPAAELRNIRKNPKKYFGNDETYKKFFTLVNAECKARKKHIRLYYDAVKRIESALFRLKNYRTLKIVDDVIARY